ncbi:3-deoxy-manno-octulosonate cytidylyltransferase [Streptomyces noursei]|uniref:3-deoxy-manno-octulosonate cytidylyltransferase n=1 Tax=Streptomyces noursei TaxID=1971 RepID=UPI00081C4FFF|nr:3-deoxy-D-manno-octulosonate cytidylyltransferase [Streptomyces noursei ATCC 11455]MCZ0992297.1 3-deoxy-manno-octulosonate cytidylyltransferase [Streptomyces noursei]
MAVTPTKPKRPPRRHIAVIPCRWGASRFPGKPLAMLGDKPLLWHVHQRCQEAQCLDDAVVATDDHRIEEVCQQLGIPCLMTGEHATGTDRVAACAQHLQADGYINVQGDEPFIDPAAIDAVSEAVAHLEAATPAVNAYTPIADTAAAIDHNVVKVVIGTDSNALMFSRQPIPYPRSGYPAYFRQLGLYGFTAAGLEVFRELDQGPLERTEGVEMLRFVEHSYNVRMLPVADAGLAVDTPEDLVRAQRLLQRTWSCPEAEVPRKCT